MKSLLILEHPEDFSLLKKHYKAGDLFIGFTPAAAYELERNKLPYKTPIDYYKGYELFSAYKECTSNLIDIIITLDTIVWKVDRRFQDSFLKPFFLGMYQFKTIIDNTKIYIYILTRIIKQESPERVIIVANKDFVTNTAKDLIFSPQDPVCSTLLSELSVLYSFKLDIIATERQRQYLKDNNIHMIRKNKLYRNLKRLKDIMISKAILFRNKGHLKAKILSVDCKDIDAIRMHLIKKNYLIESYRESDFVDIVESRVYRFHEEICRIVRSDRILRDLCCFESISFYNLIEEKIFKYLENLDIFLESYSRILNFIKNRNYTHVVLAYLKYSSYSVSTMIIDICRKQHIPCICWMHGGYGTYGSFEGYDMTDLLYGHNYFTYGETISKAINIYHPIFTIGASNQEKISLHYPVQMIKTYAVGSPFMEEQYYPSIKSNNSKKIVLFIMGEFWPHNQYYMGGNYPQPYFQKWDDVKTILLRLIDFQNRYRIILKTYPTDEITARLLNTFLKDNRGLGVEVIKNELSFDRLVQKCDLTIFTWVSTTFFEAAFTECDQFLFDDRDLTEEAKQIISETCFFSDNIEQFCHMLSDYLEKGRFYQKSKEKFLINFLDYSNIKHRYKHIDLILQKIRENNL